MRGVREEYDRKTGRLDGRGEEDERRMRGGREKRVIVFNTYLVHRCLLLCI